jgi:hypothetical protein
MEADANPVDRMVQLRFRPLWLYVDEVREFCGFFARATFGADTVGERVGLVVQAYAAALEKSVTRPAEQSGLGLARIRYEGQCDIELQLLPGSVRVTAREAAA